MYYYKLLICALVLFLCESVFSEECVDCINFNHCPAALAVLNERNQMQNEVIELFRQASCGFDASGIRPTLMVCCSMFLPKLWDIPSASSEDIRIENHKNLHLLPEECGATTSVRIRGLIADLYEFPWLALIAHATRDGISFKCTGAVINKRYILTAAHCVHNKTIVSVRLGEYNMQTDIDCRWNVCESHIQDIPVEKVVIHENYRKLPTVLNDIALIRLAENADFRYGNVLTICLPKTSELRHESLDNRYATVTSWGISENGREPSVLHTYSILIYTAQNCSGLLNRFTGRVQQNIKTEKLCAGFLNKNSCNSDPGGPLMLGTEYNNIFRYVQYGILSQGLWPCGFDYPGLYTDVTKFMGWILDNMES